MDNEVAHIIDLLMKGSSEGFRKTALRYGPPVFALALQITGNREEAEEITSDTLLKAFHAIGSYHPDKGSFKSWILRIAHNVAVSALRRRRPEVLNEDYTEIEGDSPEESVDDLELLREAIERCPEKDKALLHLYYYDKLSLGDISGITGVASTTLAVRLQRIRKKLKQYIISHHGR